MPVGNIPPDKRAACEACLDKARAVGLQVPSLFHIEGLAASRGKTDPIEALAFVEGYLFGLVEGVGLAEKFHGIGKPRPLRTAVPVQQRDITNLWGLL